jgi:acetate kinase
MKILVLNSGSSSQKTCLYEIGNSVPDDPPSCLWGGKIEWEGGNVELSLKNAQGVERKEQTQAGSRDQAVTHLLGNLWQGDAQAISSPSEIDVVGHRVVHGGPKHTEPARVTAEVKSAIAKVSDFAPLHNRAELEGMAVVEKLLGDVPQVAVFDTGFHRNMPLSAKLYPGPYEWFSQGIHRYGFHGINHEYCAGRAARLLKTDLNSLRLVSCHLGNGCSLAAIREGRSVDTTMGFTPLEGLMMGTRSGSVDPGILIYLMRQKGLSGERLDTILNK